MKSNSKWIKKGLLFAPPENLPWMRTHAAVPCAHPLGGGVYRVFFTGRDARQRSHVGYFDFDLRNPGTILRVSPRPALAPGDTGFFDEHGVMSSWILEVDGKRYLYYIGWNLGVSVPFRNAIGLAISQDGGETFARVSPGPILDRSLYDPCFTASSCVLREDRRWRMWYLSGLQWERTGEGLKHHYHIKYAESTDGVHWQRSGVVCIDFQSPGEYAISRPSVIRDAEGYKMWYSYRGTSYRIGYAESADGIRWTRKDEQAGIDVSDSGWDAEMIEYPCVFDHEGARYMLYNGNGYGKTGVGLAVWDGEPVNGKEDF